jgi:hypothetical protein
MTPKAPAAIITGTIASPSSPSVRLTAFPAPTMTKAPNRTKKSPRSSRKSLKKGKASDEPKVALLSAGGERRLHDEKHGETGDQEFDAEPGLAGKAHMSTAW